MMSLQKLKQWHESYLAGTEVEIIAKITGVNRATFYHYFKNFNLPLRPKKIRYCERCKEEIPRHKYNNLRFCKWGCRIGAPKVNPNCKHPHNIV